MALTARPDAEMHAVGSGTLLYAHQQVAVSVIRHLIARFGGALLADSPGMGKTHTALAVAREYQRVWVVAPSVLLDMWRDVARRLGIAITTMSYERLSSTHIPLDAAPDLVVLDEAHFVRNAHTRRYAAVAHLCWGAHVLLLSATPIHNARRDLVSLLALFLGSAVDCLSEVELARFIVRRTAGYESARSVVRLPVLHPLRWESVRPSPDVARAILALAPPTPPSDGGHADALVRLSLLRAWCSSDAALLESLARRLAAAAALEHALTHGRYPTKRELRAWTGSSDAIQLGFAELLAEARAPRAVEMLKVIRDHAESVRVLRGSLLGHGGDARSTTARDPERFDRLRAVLEAHRTRRAVVFTHSRATAHAAYRAVARATRAALLTGSRGLIASGDVPRSWLLAAFQPPPADSTGGPLHRTTDVARIDVLVASDVVSEGVNLPDISLVVHLDLPWTPARLEQRVGRARRLGSPHTDVLQVGIGPPLDADELRTMVQHLAAKAGVTQRLVGDVMSSHAALSPSPERAESPSIGAADAAERMRHAATPFWTLVDTDGGIDRPVYAFLSGGDRELLTVGLVERSGESSGGCAAGRERALIAVLGPERRVITSETHAAELAALLSHVRISRSSSSGIDHAGLNSVFERWCDERNAAEAIIASVAQRSAAHRDALRQITRLVHASSRADRSALPDLAASARRVVLATAGIGGELALSSLLGAAPPVGADGAVRRAWLQRLVETLADRARITGDCGAAWRLLATVPRPA